MRLVHYSLLTANGYFVLIFWILECKQQQLNKKYVNSNQSTTLVTFYIFVIVPAHKYFWNLKDSVNCRTKSN